MALTEQEKQLIRYAKENGKTKMETKAALARFRENRERVQQAQQPQTQQRGVLDRVGGALNTVFGGAKIGDAIGRQIAAGRLGQPLQRLVTGQDLTPEQERLVLEQQGPSSREVVGDVGRVGSTFLPVGRGANIAASALGRFGIRRGAQTAGSMASGAAVGAVVDTAEDLAEGREVGLGAGTAVGAGLPIAGVATNLLGQATRRGATELQGLVTGTSQETVEQAFQAARRGGDELDKFTQALRGKTTPEQLVERLRNNIDTVASENQRAFRDGLNELGDQVVDTRPAITMFRNNLEEANISVGNNNILDFSRSKLRQVPTAKNKLQTAWEEVLSLPENASLDAVDTTRQSIKAVAKIAGDEPSANLANKLIEDASRAVRGVGEDVPGYGQLLDDFGSNAEFLDELRRGVSSGDSTTVDQTFRRLATTLRTNNERRMALVRELDDATGGAILSQVSGQQLSELVPRGILSRFVGAMLGGAVATGGLSVNVLPAMALASPRATGEFFRALGVGARKAELLNEAVGDARSVLQKAGLIAGAESEGAAN